MKTHSRRPAESERSRCDVNQFRKRFDQSSVSRHVICQNRGPFPPSHAVAFGIHTMDRELIPCPQPRLCSCPTAHKPSASPRLSPLPTASRKSPSGAMAPPPRDRSRACHVGQLLRQSRLRSWTSRSTRAAGPCHLLMLRYLLDTNLCICVLRDRPPNLRPRFNAEATRSALGHRVVRTALRRRTLRKPCGNASRSRRLCEPRRPAPLRQRRGRALSQQRFFFKKENQKTFVIKAHASG
jgi:hypothetical protein